jgi:chondroitin AC lyase
MFDDEIVCLGNSITAATGYGSYDANTTLNQCNLNGDVVVSDNGSAYTTLATANEQSYDSAPKWVWHDSIGYVFPRGGKVVVANRSQSGNWYDINNNGVNAPVSRDVFSLRINHGKQVANGSYAYIIVPGKTAAEMQNYYASGNVVIVANNDSVQVVRHNVLNMYGLIFYKAASFTDDNISIKADKGCALLLKDKGKSMEMHIADPSQAQGLINIKTMIPVSAGQWLDTACDFSNTGDYRGASKAFVVVKSLSTAIREVSVEDTVTSVEYYDLTGRKIVKPPLKGVYLVLKTYRSGKRISTKSVR